MDGLVEWHDLGGAGIQLVLDAEKAGASGITIATPKMSHAREELGSVEFELEPDIQGDFGIIAQISDPDGNRITLAEAPKPAT